MDPVEQASRSFGSKRELRAFFLERYGATPPELLHVSSIGPRGTEYRYADGSRVVGIGGRWTYEKEVR